MLDGSFFQKMEVGNSVFTFYGRTESKNLHVLAIEVTKDRMPIIRAAEQVVEINGWEIFDIPVVSDKHYSYSRGWIDSITITDNAKHRNAKRTEYGLLSSRGEPDIESKAVIKELLGGRWRSKSFGFSVADTDEAVLGLMALQIPSGQVFSPRLRERFKGLQPAMTALQGLYALTQTPPTHTPTHTHTPPTHTPPTHTHAHTALPPSPSSYKPLSMQQWLTDVEKTVGPHAVNAALILAASETA